MCTDKVNKIGQNKQLQKITINCISRSSWSYLQLILIMYHRFIVARFNAAEGNYYKNVLKLSLCPDSETNS